MEINAKQLAEQSLKQLEQLEENYDNGSSADGHDFGLNFVNACVDQIINKLPTLKTVNVETLNNEFTKLLRVTQLLTDSHFALGIDKYKQSLISKVGTYPEIKQFLDPENISNVTNRFYNGVMADQSIRYNISQSVTSKDINHILSVSQLTNIPLTQVLEYLGARQEDNGSKWKIMETEHDISINGNSWFNWATEQKGQGSISLVVDYLSESQNISFNNENQKQQLVKEAINLLQNEFKSNNQSESKKQFKK